ncbi:MAG: hypothetical protein IT305_17295 [Chloroflexi bacterium]|nr:hypothetical protein [Chloroflexota bacterium]
MLEIVRHLRIGLAATTMGMATLGATAFMTAAPAEAAACHERYIAAPIDEKGIECPGNPAVWKSYTFASNGFGYYTETQNLGNGRSEVRLGYKHRDGRVAISYLECSARGCSETYWNGVQFPFGH